MHKTESVRVTATRYGKVAQAFHWITAILVLVTFLYGPGGSEQRVYAAAQDADRHLHESLGLLIFTLALFRLLWRAFDTRPDPPQVPHWMGWAAKAVQVVLYALLLALPLTAISGVWLEGHVLTLVGGMTVASPVETAHAAGATLARIHGWLGDAIMWLAGAHALAAIYHHFILRDGVFVSMLPRWIPVRQRQRK